MLTTILQNSSLRLSAFAFQFFLGLILIGPVHAALSGISIDELKTQAHAFTVKIPENVPISLEIAKNPETIAWGLMGRTSLPKDTGMLFTYSTPKTLSFWMFNTYMDLSIAFLDENHVIREIKELQSHPEKMKEYPKLQNSKDLKNISINDPVVAFFLREQVLSSFPGTFALEVPQGWFREKQVGIGDVVLWKQAKKQAFIMRSIDISRYPIDAHQPTLLVFEKEGPVSIWLPWEGTPRDVQLLDHQGVIVKQTNLQRANVLYTQTPIKYIRIFSPLTN